MEIIMGGLLFIAILAGGGPSDAVSLIQPSHYFHSRKVDLTFEKMIELAGKEPNDPKTQFQQLAALRHLADHSDAFKKSPKYTAERKVIEQIASGTRANEELGFAKEYAQRVLDKLDGKKTNLLPISTSAAEALSWFPKECNFGAVVGSQTLQFAPKFTELQLGNESEKLRLALYDFFEKSGNLRLERWAFGSTFGPDFSGMKNYTRLTGKANHSWLFIALKNTPNANLDVVSQPLIDGKPVTFAIEKSKSGEMILGIGNTDIVVLTAEKYSPNQKKNPFQSILDARGKSSDNATSGVLKGLISAVPATAKAFAVGELSLGKEKGRAMSMFAHELIGKTVVAYVERREDLIEITGHVTMETAAQSENAVGAFLILRRSMLEDTERGINDPNVSKTEKLKLEKTLAILKNLSAKSEKKEVRYRLSVSMGLVEELFILNASAIPEPMNEQPKKQQPF